MCVCACISLSLSLSLSLSRSLARSLARSLEGCSALDLEQVKTFFSFGRRSTDVSVAVSGLPVAAKGPLNDLLQEQAVPFWKTVPL